VGLRSRIGARLLRSDPTLSVDAYLQMTQMMTYLGHTYGVGGGGTLAQKQEPPDPSFAGYAWLMKSNPVIFACAQRRVGLFKQARFQFRQMRSGRPGDLFGDPDLGVLEQPWPNGTTGDLLARALLTADAAGNFYAVRSGNRVEWLRPDWMTIVLGSDRAGAQFVDPDVQLAGYAYWPGGSGSGKKAIPLLPEEVCHFVPTPDPVARFRGMSWLDPIITELMADQAMSRHRLKFFEQGATPNMIMATDITDKDLFEQVVAMYRAQSEGGGKAYQTLFTMAGHSPTIVGTNLRQIDFKTVQGAGETRIAAAAGVPPIVVGLSEGLDAATYSNYGQARRAFADGTMRELWQNMAGSFETLLKPRSDGAHLWYDDRDIPFLQEDRKDAATIQGTQATTIAGLVREGFEPGSVIDAVNAEDWSRLKHTGKTSVQLHDPNAPPASPNGSTGVPPGTEQPALPAGK
jgi:phage portal protein BeeE